MTFDIIFIDADKGNYQNYYDEAIDLIKKDALIIIDNVLWHGEVANMKKIMINLLKLLEILIIILKMIKKLNK